jgi:hypothetical protein
MSDKQWDNLADITGVLLAGFLLTVSLLHLIPEGMWLYLVGLILGTVILTNKVNRVLRG